MNQIAKAQAELNIYQRLNKVRENVTYLQKDKEVQGYKAITHDAVTAAVRPLFIKNGICVVPSLVEARTIQDTKMSTKNGVPIIRYEGTYDVAFVNIDNPEDRVVVRLESHALDQGDKAPGKAISYVVKYAMLKVLSLETGEDDEGRQQHESADVTEFRKIVNEGRAEDLFDMRYTRTIEEWNAITAVARADAEKKRDWDGMVKDLLEQAESTFSRTIVLVRECISAEDGPGTMELLDELTVPQKRYVWSSMNANERAFINQHSTKKAA